MYRELARPRRRGPGNGSSRELALDSRSILGLRDPGARVEKGATVGEVHAGVFRRAAFESDSFLAVATSTVITVLDLESDKDVRGG